MRPLCTAVVLVVLTASCVSAPDLTHYTIDMTPSGSADSDVGFVVERLTVSERLDRSRIVIQATPIRVDSYATARWAEGLGGMVQHKLAVELGSDKDDARVIVVSGRVLAFEQVDASTPVRALVRLEVGLRNHETPRYEPALLERTYEASRPLDGAGVEPLVRALSRALEDVAARIAEDADSL